MFIQDLSYAYFHPVTKQYYVGILLEYPDFDDYCSPDEIHFSGIFKKGYFKYRVDTYFCDDFQQQLKDEGYISYENHDNIEVLNLLEEMKPIFQKYWAWEKLRY